MAYATNVDKVPLKVLDQLVSSFKDVDFKILVIADLPCNLHNHAKNTLVSA